ncbi:MAG: dihydrodipicolinate synthase family protein [Planctomycetota bacterium]|nr:dihydrodipicolinate synthase family protein [Planctomycetota bacterium]
MRFAITGLLAATHTPFSPSGELNLALVEKQAEHLASHGVSGVFIGGTTGESASLSLEERLALARRWAEVTRGGPLNLVVHVGANCLADARALAAQAEQLGVAAISAVAPSYFKPASLQALVECCADVARAAPNTPYYHYDIPGMTGMSLSMPDFLEKAGDQVKTLAGIKFSNPDLLAYQLCLRAAGGRYDMPFGCDEYLLAALVLGCGGAVGSTYNFAAPIYQRLLAAFQRGDLQAAREEQFRSARLVRLLCSYGYIGAAKATMGFLGVEVGPPRLPNQGLVGEQQARLRADLEELGFFEWLQG